jgi:hypothetical protein
MVDDIDAARRELLECGVTSVSDIDGERGLGRWAYFKDPEGNVFEIKEEGRPPDHEIARGPSRWTGLRCSLGQGRAGRPFTSQASTPAGVARIELVRADETPTDIRPVRLHATGGPVRLAGRIVVQA